MNKKLKIMLVVGEISGDAHAAKLVEALEKNSPGTEFEFFGATGIQMRKAGVETIVKADDFARVGILEVAAALPMFLSIFKKVKKTAIEREPDAVILIDFPDFNLKLATALKKKGLKIIYYISPQVWAWKKYRVKRIKKYVDLLLTILPFEKAWYKKEEFEKVQYVGNPLAGEIYSKKSRQEFCLEHDLDNSLPIISLLPGSRRNEIERNLPVLIETASFMQTKQKNLQFIIPLASIRKTSEVESVIKRLENEGLHIPKKLFIVKNETYEAINASDVAAVTSGTATLETAILGTPMVIVYKVSKLNYSVLKHFISVEHIGLVNLIAEKKLAKELIQDEFNAINLSRELFRLLDENENNLMRKELIEIKQTLGNGGASDRAAKAILNELGF